jgi:Na+/H+ antiporter NhaD/arsenite permease-like protein
MATVLPLTVFLAAAIWLATFAERTGVAGAMAERLWRAAAGRPAGLYVRICLLCAALTATVSLDGAVVLMVPVLLALTERAPALRRALLFGTVGVANAFSLALPQGNPTNLVVIERLGISPSDFVGHLFVPAVVATLLCACAVAAWQGPALRANGGDEGVLGADLPAPGASDGPDRGAVRGAPGPGAPLALGALLVAALGGAIAPWVGIAGWWPLSVAAAVAFAASRFGRLEAPGIEVPWKIVLQVGVLVVAFQALPDLLHPAGAGYALALAVALGAAAVASIANNLPASVALTGLLGAAPLPAYAALTGLSVGALATPRGSVATLIAFDRAHEPTDGYLRRWLPIATAATIAATLLLTATV